MSADDIGAIAQAGVTGITGIAIAGATLKATQKAFGSSRSDSKKKNKVPKF